MNKSQSKYFNTACLMDEALIRLLENKDFEYITVKEVCQKAGVNRSTFYLHYETMDDLLKESMEWLLRDFFSSFGEKVREEPSDFSCLSLKELIFINKDYLVPYLEYIYEHRKLMMTVMRQPYATQVSAVFDSLSEKVLNSVMEKFGIPEKERKYRLVFYFSGINSVVEKWIGGGCTESVPEIADLISMVILPVGEEERAMLRRIFSDVP